MNENDPLFDRYIELEDRKDRLVTMQEHYANMRGAPGVISRQEAIGIDELGALDNEEADQILIHTKEAYRMFMGRARDPERKYAPIPGGRQVAGALRRLWLMTRDNNPYADWALLRHEGLIKDLGKRIKTAMKRAEQVIEAQKRKGLTYSILRSMNPVPINLGMRSPYGYAVTSLIADYDYFIRLEKTLSRKNLLSDAEVRRHILRMSRLMRRVFSETTRFSRWLTQDEVAALSRSDFLPGASAEALKRVEFVLQVFGPVPGVVFSADLQPRHTRRFQEMAAEERRLLHEVAAKLDSGQFAALDAAVADTAASAAKQEAAAAAPAEAAATKDGQGDSGAGETQRMRRERPKDEAGAGGK